MKMRKWKKYVALLLALAMVASLTVTSLAETDDSDTIEGVVVEASESADVEVIDDTEDEEVSDADAVVEQTEDADAAETEVEAADVSEETVDVSEDEAEGNLNVSDQSVRVLSSEDEDGGYYSYYSISCEDEDVLVNDSYYISREWSVYYYAEYYDEDTENWGCEDGYCEVESINVSGPATYEEDEYGDYWITPSEAGEVTVTLNYTPASGVEDTEYNGEYTVTLNAVDEQEGYYVNVYSDTDFLLPGETAVVDATVYYWTDSSEYGYDVNEYDGEVTYVWEVEDWDDVLVSTSDMGSSYSVTVNDSLGDVEESWVTVYVEVYGEDEELLCSEYSSITVGNEYYELVLSQDSYYLTEGDTVEVEPTLYLCTVDGRTPVTSGVTYYIDSDYAAASWGSYGDNEIYIEDIFSIDEMNIGVPVLPSGLTDAQATYNVIAEIDDESVAYTPVTVSVYIPAVYEYSYGYSDQNHMVDVGFYISKDYSVGCSIETWYQGEYDSTYENIVVNAVTAVNDEGESLDVEETDDDFIITPEEEGTVTITLYYDPIDGSDDENDGQYSFNLYISDTLIGYYLDVESDNSTGTLVPGQSLNLTATYMYYMESADGYDEGVYDGTVIYDWYIDYDSCSSDDVVTLSSSDATCEVIANSSLDEDEGYAQIVVEALDEDGNLLETGYYYVDVRSEYYVLSVEEDTFSMEPGESVTIEPVWIYYSAENPKGEVVPINDAKYDLSVFGYYLLDEEEYVWLGYEDEENEINAISIDSTSLEITAISTKYDNIDAYILLYAEMDDEGYYYEDIIVSVTSDSEVQECEHPNLTYHEAVDPSCTTDGNKEYWGCNDCGLMFSDSDVTDVISEAEVIIPATGHSYVKLSTDVQDATCTEDGMITTGYECEYCGDSYEKIETIPATGHVWNEEAEWTWADDYSSATATFTCAVCGEPGDGEVAITSEQTEEGITYTAEATLDNVSDTDKKFVSITSEVLTSETQASVSDSVEEAYQEIALDVADSVDVGDALEDVAEELSDAVDYAEVLEKLAEEGITVDETSEVTITTETYLKTTVLNLVIDEENQTAVLTIDISMYYTVTASVGSYSEIVDEGEVTTKTTWDPIEVTIDVAGIPFADADSIYVKHDASDGTYYYKATYNASDETITFTNLHGFSEFTVSVDSRTATVYYSDLDQTETYAPTEVSSALPTASKSGYTFNGWTFDGVEGTYTTLTDDLLTALSALGVDKVTATASFTEIVSEDTDSETVDNTKDNNAGDNTTDTVDSTTDTTANTDSTTDSSSATTTSTSTTATGDYNTTGLWVVLVLAGAAAVFGVIRRRSNAR